MIISIYLFILEEKDILKSAPSRGNSTDSNKKPPQNIKVSILVLYFELKLQKYS